jgi:predicted Rossmann fold flavoprotein
MKNIDVIIIGAGAAGLMCAIEAAKRGRKVLVLEHANKPGKKILMSGGGRCNFTNYNINPSCYISNNPNFCKSALARYTQWDFIKLVQKYNIPFHEKKHGQLFCDNKSKDIVDMLLAECKLYNVSILLNTDIKKVSKSQNTVDYPYTVATNTHDYQCISLVIATGGLSIPTMGATPFGYKIAEQFGLNLMPTRAALVPLTLHQHDKDKLLPISGVSADCMVASPHQSFTESILFTHRGLSGPVILQISSYWFSGETLTINFFPNLDLAANLHDFKKSRPKILLKNILTNYLPKSLVVTLLVPSLADKSLQMLSNDDIKHIVQLFTSWQIKPNGTEGYRTAEVTLGGVDCNEISSKTMEAIKVKGLYFIGEVLDVTGWLGGFNFQWAWSSGWACGQFV